jgi:hydroxyacylglutathione hydrolase
MIIKQFVLGALENNNYLLIDDESKEAVLIDCTQENGDIENALLEHNAKLKYLLLTHGHFDHILGVNYFRNKYNCEVLLHEADRILIERMPEFAKAFGLPPAEIQKVDRYINENDTIKFAGTQIKVIHTPGHTQGCVCYLVNDDLFTGDTLFYESVGRTDLPGGSFKQIVSSIKEKLFVLDDNIKVYPGHGPTSTIGHEKANNQFV